MSPYCITCPQKYLQRIARHHGDVFPGTCLYPHFSHPPFPGTGTVTSSLSGTYHSNISETNGLTVSYSVSFYLLYLILMPFLQYNLHETHRYPHILSDGTGCTCQSDNVQFRAGTLSTFNSVCSFPFVTARITEKQVAAITYLKRNLVKFHLGNLGFSERVFSRVGGILVVSVRL